MRDHFSNMRERNRIASPDDMVELTLEMRKRLHNMRRLAGLKQEEAADVLDIDQSNISGFENTQNTEHPRRTNISKEDIRRLAKAYGCSEKFLLCESDDPELAVRGSSDTATPAGAKRMRSPPIRVTLWPHYPEGHDDLFADAKSLRLSGLNMRRLGFKQINDIREILARRGTVKIVLVKPGTAAAHYSAIQDFGLDYGDTDDYNGSIRAMVRTLRGLQSGVNGDNLKLKWIDFPLGRGFDLIRGPGAEDGIVFVREYPMHSLAVNDDHPITDLKPSDGYWYQFYQRQWLLTWRMAKYPEKDPELQIGSSVDRKSGGKNGNR